MRPSPGDPTQQILRTILPGLEGLRYSIQEIQLKLDAPSSQANPSGLYASSYVNPYAAAITAHNPMNPLASVSVKVPYRPDSWKDAFKPEAFKNPFVNDEPG